MRKTSQLGNQAFLYSLNLSHIITSGKSSVWHFACHLRQSAYKSGGLKMQYSGGILQTAKEKMA